MFDKLVESTNQKRAGRTGRYFLTTTLAYAGALTLLGLMTIFWFNPALADTLEVAGILTPPPPLSGPPPQANRVQINETPRDIFATPTRPPERIADPREVPPSNPRPQNSQHPDIVGAPQFGPGNGTGIIPGGTENDAIPPPPPQPVVPPTPAPTPAPTPTPQQTVRMTSQMTQSKAIRRVQPPYPAIAKSAHVSGPVQVQVTISEDGTVNDAAVLSGHPLLREASVQAARQWVFSPTLLNGKPVRVVGVLTFNFTLN